MTQTRAEQFFNLKAVDVAARHIQSEQSRKKQDSVQTIQTSHRLDILYALLTGDDPTSPASGSEGQVEADYTLLSGNMMDLGCGQGDQTGVLAAVLSNNPERYKESKTGPEMLKERSFDTVLLSHSSWYFPSAQVLTASFKSIREAGVKHLLLAEWAMTASHPNALPHLLSVLLQGQSPVEGGNVQTALSPEQMKKVGADSGWKVKRELTFLPAEKLQDGGWEVYMAREAADEAAKADAGGDEVKAKLLQLVQATRYALEEAAARYGKQTRSMDVWTAVLTPP
ncbi:uncharacterized protein UBRO_20974 [Ustilago bromivora]|uniref:Uncharacterized protein n=2 Tax=Ustilago bromivora TaxID=307758 RepID=A0A1K0HD93_9BASI|nr:uncharacterized protein UBRO_20974 [Ustilago bromivora]